MLLKRVVSMIYIISLILLLPLNLFAAEEKKDSEGKAVPMAPLTAPLTALELRYMCEDGQLRAGGRKAKAVNRVREDSREEEVFEIEDTGGTPLQQPSLDKRVSVSHEGVISFRENYNPKGHPILSKSRAAKGYVECSTICCFLSNKWFKMGAFLSNVATCGLAGLAYGVEDPATKDKLNLAILLLTITSAALKKFEGFAHSAVHDQEKEYKMFDISDVV